MSLTALVIIYDDDKYYRSISERTKKEDGTIRRGGIVGNRSELT